MGIVSWVQPRNVEVEARYVAEREHDAGQRQRHHDDDVERGSSEEPLKGEKVRDRYAEDDVEERTAAGKQQRVLDAEHREISGENFSVEAADGFTRQDREEPFAGYGSEHDTEVWQDGNEDHQPDRRRAEPAARASQ